MCSAWHASWKGNFHQQAYSHLEMSLLLMRFEPGLSARTASCDALLIFTKQRHKTILHDHQGNQGDVFMAS